MKNWILCKHFFSGLFSTPDVKWKTLIICGLTCLFIFETFAQNKTDISLYLKQEPGNYLGQVSAKSGDLYNELGHHGPAVENEWIGLRMYFDHKTAIDVYSKKRPGLELGTSRWYPDSSQQIKGYGADYYKVGATVGLGGVRLWDGENVVPLNPVSKRSARVVKEGTISYMEMLSEDIPYKGGQVDILVRVTVYTGIREAKVEAFALTDNEVQFVTGINYHDGQTIIEKENYILTWGLHPEDVAPEKVRIGAAILFNGDYFTGKKNDGTQVLLISHPCRQLEHWITSANERESGINTLEKFSEYVESKRDLCAGNTSVFP